MAFFVLSCGTLVRKTTMGGPIFVVWGIYSGAKKVGLLGGSTLEVLVLRRARALRGASRENKTESSPRPGLVSTKF
jgi:hypothetical protein